MRSRLIAINGNAVGTIGATGASRAANVATIVTSAISVVVGAKITIAGVTPSTFNGTFVILTVPDTTHFTYANTGADETSTVGGTATPEYRDIEASIACMKATIIEDDSGTRQGLNYKLPDDNFAQVYNAATSEQPLELGSEVQRGAGFGSGTVLGMPAQNAPSTQTNYRAADVLIKLLSRTATSTKVHITEQE